MAGLVTQVVAIHFETASNTKAENAERAFADDKVLSPFLLVFFFNSLCFK